MIYDIVWCEAVGIALAEELVEVATCVGEFLVIADNQRVVFHRQSAKKRRHAFRVEVFPDVFVDYGEFCLAVVDEMLDVVRFEIGKYGDYDRSIGECADEGHTPH